MHNSLYTFLMDNNLLYSRQSGFRRMYSTETALIKLVDELLFGLDNNHVCGMVLVDYRKAFDTVDHKLLLRKLELYGIVNRELAWCHSYLLDRKQLVRVNGSESSEALMLHGVPQGSILGPLFFIFFYQRSALVYKRSVGPLRRRYDCHCFCGCEKLSHLKVIPHICIAHPYCA